MHTYKVNTGHEAALEREVARLKELLIEREDKWDDAMNENRQLQNKIGELKSTCAVLEGRIDEMRDSAFGNNNTISHLKEKYEEAKTNMALMTDELEKLRREKVYPFKEGDIYYVFNQLDGTWIESVWDDESERIHDSAHIPSRPHRVYFTVDQKNVLDKFNPVADLREDMEDQTKLVDDLRYHINAFMAAVEETIDL